VNDHDKIVDEIAHRAILNFYEEEEEEKDDKEEDGDNDNDAHH
jgi:hypothetical protein